jgi:hypothetical protein
MTHNELIEKIEHYDYVAAAYLIQALRAVVELHRPYPSGVCGCELDSPAVSYMYPCMTIQAIEEELK